MLRRKWDDDNLVTDKQQLKRPKKLFSLVILYHIWLFHQTFVVAYSITNICKTFPTCNGM